MHRTARKILRAVANYDPDYYDMCADANEQFFAQLYIERIQRCAEAAGIRPPATEAGTPAASFGEAKRAGVADGSAERRSLRPTEPGAPRVARGGDGSAGVGGRPRPTLLEAGCQAGRLVIPFAKLGFDVTGIDASGFALRRAKQHARSAGVAATFLQGDLLRILPTHAARYDIVVCAEVVYLSPDYRQLLRVLANAVRPGGLLCVSHRSKFYYLFEAIRQYDLETARAVLQTREGRFRDSAYFNWQTEEDLRALYHEVGLTWVAMYPIDRFAWLSGISPSQLTSDQRAQWLRLELESGTLAPTCGRYLLVMATRP